MVVQQQWSEEKQSHHQSRCRLHHVRLSIYCPVSHSKLIEGSQCTPLRLYRGWSTQIEPIGMFSLASAVFVIKRADIVWKELVHTGRYRGSHCVGRLYCPSSFDGILITYSNTRFCGLTSAVRVENSWMVPISVTSDVRCSNEGAIKGISASLCLEAGFQQQVDREGRWS